MIERRDASLTVVFCCILTLTLIPVSVKANGNGSKAALIIIDVQDCFISGGSLAVGGADDIIPVINKLRADYGGLFHTVVLSQDWHPAGHVSFASAHPGRPNPLPLRYTSQGKLCTDGSSVTAKTFPEAVSCKNLTSTLDLQQTLWPDHCLQNVSTGPTSSAFADRLTIGQEDLIIQKGVHKEIDSYSAFFDNGGFQSTRLDKELRQRGITTVMVAGLAGDFCVYYTSLDAHRLGYETYYLLDATRFVTEDTKTAALTDLVRKGVSVITTHQVASVLSTLGQGNSSPPPPPPLNSLLLLLGTAMMILVGVCRVL